MAELVITVNGETMHVQQESTIADLIGQMDLLGKRIAVERNLEIVPRSEHASMRLQANDNIEIVQAIGGG